ncbi:MAG: germination protein YpeB [Bacillota bacterium]
MGTKGVLKITRREWIIPTIVGLVLAGIIGYWGYSQYEEKERLAVYMGNNYQQSFYEVVEQIEQLQVLLGKSLVSTSPRENIINLTDVWNHANRAQSELSRLPLEAQTVYDTAKFLNQTGDFSHVMARKNVDGQAISSEDRGTLKQLRGHAIEVVESLQKVEQEVMDGKINWVELVKGARNEIKAQEGNPNPEDGNEPFDMNGSFNDIRDEMSKIPVLIYDGPFSDHISERKPLGLTGDEISEEEAKEKARDFIDDDDNDAEFTDASSVDGRIAAYNFQIKTGNGVYSVDVSKKGGHLVSMINNRSADEDRIAMNEAVDKSRDYLARYGYPNMEATYSEVKGNVAYISFAYQQDDILYYPDIINLQVALDNGQVLAVDASKYLISHNERQVEEPELTEEEAREIVNSSLDEIENVRLTVIPKPSGSEVFTYEVRGVVGEEVYIIYINAMDGNEEQILKVVMGEQGTFAL